MTDPMASQSLAGACKQKNGAGECVKVVVRARPLNSTEISEGRQQILHMDTKESVAILHKPGGTDKDDKDFTFDAVFDETCGQQQIFEEAALEIVESVMDGFNGTIFAYGQTGAGKSFTMTGPEGAADLETQGLIPRSFMHIFDQIQTNSASVTYLVRGSYIEIYNEEIRDLLAKDPKARCELKDSQNSGVYVKDLSAFIVKSEAEMGQLLTNGLRNRSVGATNMNAESSRSHSIFMLTVEQAIETEDANGESQIRVGKLNLVDLAGSERQSKTGASGERLKEATKINLSLSALGNVISALVDGKSSHIPYRDSKLTRLLQDSLGGNTKTVMVANCGPADYNYDETLCTLRYAVRAKSIRNKPRINEDPKDAMIKQFQSEILRLKAELTRCGSGGVDADLEESADAPPRAKLSPRIEKKIEYVTKVVEKTVEREQIVEHGPNPEEVAKMEEMLRKQNEERAAEAERKRKEIAEARDLAESEKQRLYAELERTEQEALNEEQRKTDLQRQLMDMEQRMLAGKQVMKKAMEQEEQLKRQQRELKKRQQIEARLKKQEEQQRLEVSELETKCASQEEQVQTLTRRLHKLWDKYKKAQQEMVDIQQFNQREREDMLTMIRDLRQTLKLKALIMEAYVPQKHVDATQGRAYWDAEEDEWKLRPLKDKDFRPSRPASVLGLPRPAAEFTRLRRASGDEDVRFLHDCIVNASLDLSESTCEDWEPHVELGDQVEKTLLFALAVEGNDASPHSDKGLDGEAGSDRPRLGGPPHGRPVSQSRKLSKRPGADNRPCTGSNARAALLDVAPAAAFPLARGLVSRE